MNKPTTHKKETPPHSIDQLEQRAKLRYGRMSRTQIGLGKLLLATNLVGISLALILATNGFAIAVAIFAAFICGLFLPAIVLLGICLVELGERMFGVSPRPLASELRKPQEKKSPFDD